MRAWLLTSAMLASCSPAAPSAGEGPKPPEVSKELDGGCVDAGDQLSPLLIEAPTALRAALERGADEPPTVVSYDGCRLRVLERCSAPGRYRYSGLSLKQDRLEVRSQDELQAKLPLGAVKLGAALKQSGALTLDMHTIGRLASTRARVARDELDGECEGATHVVARLHVGAFELTRGAEQSVGGEVGAFGVEVEGSTSRSREALSRDGSADACRQAQLERSRGKTIEASPPANCSGVLGVQLQAVAAPLGLTPTMKQASRRRFRQAVNFHVQTQRLRSELLAKGKDEALQADLLKLASAAADAWNAALDQAPEGSAEFCEASYYRQDALFSALQARRMSGQRGLVERTAFEEATFEVCPEPRDTRLDALHAYMLVLKDDLRKVDPDYASGGAPIEPASETLPGEVNAYLRGADMLLREYPLEDGYPQSELAAWEAANVRVRYGRSAEAEPMLVKLHQQTCARHDVLSFYSWQLLVGIATRQQDKQRVKSVLGMKTCAKRADDQAREREIRGAVGQWLSAQETTPGGAPPPPIGKKPEPAVKRIKRVKIYDPSMGESEALSRFRRGVRRAAGRVGGCYKAVEAEVPDGGKLVLEVEVNEKGKVATISRAASSTFAHEKLQRCVEGVLRKVETDEGEGFSVSLPFVFKRAN